MNARTMTAAVILAGVAAASAACTTTTTASGPGPLLVPKPATAERPTFAQDGAAFAEYIRATSNSLDDMSDLAMWETGLKVCAAFDAGVTMDAYIAGMDGIPSDIVYAFPVGAITYICSRNQSIVDAYNGQ